MNYTHAEIRECVGRQSTEISTNRKILIGVNNVGLTL
jgi:hypothetical protein